MKLIKTSLLAMVLLFTVASCSKDEAVVEETVHYTIDVNLAQETDWTMANEILDLVNAHRTSQGLSTLKRDQQYASAYAVDHTKYMISIEDINHDNFQTRKEAMKDRGAIRVSENVAYGYQTAEAVVTAWLNSPDHRKNIEGDFTHLGFGVLQSEDDSRYYFTQLFYKK
ncbi:CAP domain-containing protein [Luteirhabdus pelagi]|jgi:uncharacterized protein YkwD|uniref:CAP domain-containing protein n=1 Tax=Luteirhabdus pelagi TaxID=2792783 RepID=UPI0019397463|nr:CAP domain-containing protein [Luteirhabdus pelagi]